jgi:hypothetical protein
MNAHLSNGSAFGGGFPVRFVQRSQCLNSIVAFIALTTVSLVNAGCSVTQERETSSQAAWAMRTPSTAIEMAFAALNAPSANDDAVNRPRRQASCDDLEFSFLNSRCSKLRKKHAGLKRPRVATFISGGGKSTTKPSIETEVNEAGAASTDINSGSSRPDIQRAVAR